MVAQAAYLPNESIRDDQALNFCQQRSALRSEVVPEIWTGC